MATQIREPRAAPSLTLPVSALAAVALGAVTLATITLAAAATSSAHTTVAEVVHAEPTDASVTDIVLTVGPDHTQRNIAWYSPTQGEGEVQWAPASALEGDDFPQSQAQSAGATTNGETHDGRYYFHAAMSGLESATDYVYRVGAEGVWSDPHKFSTGDFDAEQFSFVAVGDPQLGNSGDVDADREGWDHTLATALDMVPDAAFVLSMGDQVQDAANENEYAALLSPDALTSVPFAFNLGNHDVDSSAYETHFHLPGTGDTPGNFWFTYGDVLIISVDSNTFDANAHASFIGDVIAEHGADARWHIVTFHHTVFGVAEYSTAPELVGLRGEIAPILSEHSVDLVLMGHDHAYSRTHLMDGREPVVADDPSDLHPTAHEVLYLTLNSASGSRYYALLDDEDLDAADPDGFNYAHATWQDEVPTFTQVDVASSALTIATYRTDSGEAIDEFVLTHPDGEADTPDSSPTRSAPAANPEPTTNSPSPTPAEPTPKSTTESTDGGLPAATAVAIVAVLAAIAVGVAVLVRRRPAGDRFDEE